MWSRDWRRRNRSGKAQQAIELDGRHLPQAPAVLEGRASEEREGNLSSLPDGQIPPPALS